MSRHASYRPPWWLPGGHLQTIHASLAAQPRAVPHYRRTRWESPDGDFVDIDWIDGAATAPLLILFHGLEGGSRSHYARALMHAASVRGWRGAVAHFRGCSGEPNRLPRAYHSGDTTEAAWLLARFHEAAGAAPLLAVGVSLGGNVLLKWAGEQGEAACRVIAAAVAVSPPVDLRSCGEKLALGFNRVYTRMFLSTMKAKGEEKAARFPGSFDLEAMRRSSTLREYDDVVTAPLHGYIDCDDYWSRASSRPFLRGIRVPTLLLSARNDPFLGAECFPGREHVSDRVTLEYTRHGGHVGFVGGRFPGLLDWLPGRIIRHFSDSVHGLV